MTGKPIEFRLWRYGNLVKVSYSFIFIGGTFIFVYRKYIIYVQILLANDNCSPPRIKGNMHQIPICSLYCIETLISFIFLCTEFPSPLMINFISYTWQVSNFPPQDNLHRNPHVSLFSAQNSPMLRITCIKHPPDLFLFALINPLSSILVLFAPLRGKDGHLPY